MSDEQGIGKAEENKMVGRFTEREKVRRVYGLIGDRGLYVSTNYDVFSEDPEMVALAGGAGYQIPLLKNGSRAYASPLLFTTLTSLLNHGTMLLTGAKGIGKTTSAEFAGHFFTGTPLEEILAAEIQGHPQQTEEKMVASYDLAKLMQGEKVVIPDRFLQCPVKILDEVNRNSSEVLSILMKVVDTGRAVYGGQVLTAKPGPLFSTANYSDEGTFQLTPPFLDRYDVAVMVTSPQPWDLRSIRARGDEKLNGNLEKLLRLPEGLVLNFPKIRKEINGMPHETEYDISTLDEFADFTYASLRFSEAASDNVARATKGNAWLSNQDNSPAGHFTDSSFTYTNDELSVRTVKAMQRYAKAFAWFNGDARVGREQLKIVLPYLLWHKIQPTQNALTRNSKYGNDRIGFVESIIEKVQEEYDELRDSPARKTYVAALHAIKSSKVGDKALTEEEVRNVTRNAIQEIGMVDKPWAISLSAHLASVYNARYNGEAKQEEE